MKRPIRMNTTMSDYIYRHPRDAERDLRVSSANAGLLSGECEGCAVVSGRLVRIEVAHYSIEICDDCVREVLNQISMLSPPCPAPEFQDTKLPHLR